jgi:hypothetical protein
MIRTLSLASTLLFFSLPAFAATDADYKPMGFSDFLLDYKTLSDDTKIAITGYYMREGTTEVLVSDPTTQNLWVMLYMDSAARTGRKRLLDCIDHTRACRATFLARTGCTTTNHGGAVDAPCLIVDDVRDPPHHASPMPVTPYVAPDRVLP